MKAAYIQATGPADSIIVGDLPVPHIGPHQVRVRVQAVSVNPIDTYIRSGAVAMPIPLPFIVGCDVAGVVDQVGEQVTDLPIGTPVWASNQGLLGRQGTFAEYVAVDRQWLHRRPAQVTAPEAAACALVGLTAHIGLFRDAQLKVGETICVIGGTGGVGSMVVQMAKAIGATVITTAGSDEKVDACKKLGADHVIPYHRHKIAEGLQQFAPDGVNVFWETRRTPDFDVAVAAMAPRGRMILMAGRDARPEFPVGPFYVKECQLKGFVVFKASADEIQIAAEDMNRWMAEGSLRANISHQLPLDEAAEAHFLQEHSTIHGTSRLAGKIVLTTPYGDESSN